MECIKYGMVGGDLKALIGEVHRKGIAFDPRAKLVCGCFSAIDELNVECADYYNVDRNRVYFNYKDMVAKEAGNIDFVAICTPNHVHYEIAKAFLEAGVNVMCEKPLTFTVEEAEELAAIVKEKNLLFAVNYCYSGYPMAKVMKDMIARGDIGEIVSIAGEYSSGCFLNVLHEKGDVSNFWRSNPKYSGISNTVADDGTHIEHFVSYVTGLKIKRVAATVDRFGKKLEFNSNILVEYENGVHGAYWFCQVACGKSNEMEFRVYGAEGSLEWRQVCPDEVVYRKRGEAVRILSRAGAGMSDDAKRYFRLPYGHPEGYYVAQANIYRAFLNAVLKKKKGEPLTADDLDFPNVDDGVSGVKFVHAVIESGDNDSKWVAINR
ncbi:MAG: Gfo/Idh/MocA family protein [Acetivibrionales bacterium]|jgi:predicted dehydrogenase